MSSLGKRIEVLRKSAGLSRAVVAHRLGKTWNWIYLIETGQRNPTTPTLYALADMFDVEPTKFFEEDAKHVA